MKYLFQPSGKPLPGLNKFMKRWGQEFYLCPHKCPEILPKAFINAASAGRKMTWCNVKTTARWCAPGGQGCLMAWI